MQRLPCTAAKVSKTLLYLLHKGWLRKFYLVHIFTTRSLVLDFPAASAYASCCLFSRSRYLLRLLIMTTQYPHPPEQSKFQQTDSYGMFNSKDTKDNIE